MKQLEVMLSAERIAQRVAEMGQTLTEAYGDRELQVVGVLKGSFVFLADLVRRMEVPTRVHFLGVSSYEGSASTGQVQITHDLSAPMEGKDILLVEDIVDTGLTLRYIIDALEARKPKSLEVAALLDKPDRRQVQVNADYVGFAIPDKFVVGYGLDYNGLYRNLDHVAIYTE